jgi:hypothetical protein
LRKLSKKWAIARQIRHDSGLLALLKDSLRFMVKPFYQHNTYYLSKYDVSKSLSLNTNPPMCKNYELNFKVVSSNKEAEQLEREGFEFRSYRNNIAHYTNSPARLLDYGLLAFCTFAGKELAAISWIIPSQQTQDKVKAPPLKVNYSENEAFPRGAWSNPKYRGLGIYRYNNFNRDKYLSEKRINILRAAISVRNETGPGLLQALGTRKYGEATLTRILFWKFWKEKPTILPIL